MLPNKYRAGEANDRSTASARSSSIMNVSPRQVIAVEFFTLFILWLAISARTYLIWNKPPSWQKIACQALLYAACVLDTVAVAIICNLTFRQLKFRDAYPQEVAIPLLFVRDSFNAMVPWPTIPLG